MLLHSVEWVAVWRNKPYLSIASEGLGRCRSRGTVITFPSGGNTCSMRIFGVHTDTHTCDWEAAYPLPLEH